VTSVMGAAKNKLKLEHGIKVQNHSRRAGEGVGGRTHTSGDEGRVRDKKQCGGRAKWST